MGERGSGGDVNSNVLVARSTGDAQLDKAVWQWLSWDKNPKTKEQIEILLQDGKHKELRDRLCCRLTFGTAGLRSAMGAGFCYINDLTVIQSTQVWSIAAQEGTEVISHSPFGSFGLTQCFLPAVDRLAKLTAAVLLAKDVPVYFFSTYVPTPFVPYAVQQLKAVAGVMITASHNRKEDNGYKASPRLEVTSLCRLYNYMFYSSYWHKKHFAFVGVSFTSSLSHTHEHKKVFIFHCFPLATQQPLKVWTILTKHDKIIIVKVVCVPMGFMKDSSQQKRERFSTLLCPVCSGCWKVFTGNELAALFGWWMFSRWKENCSQDADVKNVYMLATTVSSKILRAIALKEGFHFEETLPGFKWIGSRVKDLLDNGKEVLFAFEESIGFMCGTSVLDKDGVSAAVVIAEMAAYLESKNQTLEQKLTEIYETYGYHIAKTSYFLCYDPPTIKRLFERLRNFDGPQSYPKFCGDYSILHVRDVTTGYDSSQPNKKSVLPVSKSSQMITFTFQNSCVATLRTSGTEPKIKYYAEMCAPPEQSDRTFVEEELQKLIAALIGNFLEPDKNGLIWRSA
ncbi:PGM2L synthase, partial [Nothocercus nigrocapillus]|nr:PGM2L synthase [Nothocercus nigrocapillus]